MVPHLFFRIEEVLAVSSSKLFLNWTVVEWNQPVTGYSLSYREEGDNSWRYYQVVCVRFPIQIRVYADPVSILLQKLTNQNVFISSLKPVVSAFAL